MFVRVGCCLSTLTLDVEGHPRGKEKSVSCSGCQERLVGTSGAVAGRSGRNGGNGCGEGGVLGGGAVGRRDVRAALEGEEPRGGPAAGGAAEGIGGAQAWRTGGRTAVSRGRTWGASPPGIYRLLPIPETRKRAGRASPPRLRSWPLNGARVASPRRRILRPVRSKYSTSQTRRRSRTNPGEHTETRGLCGHLPPLLCDRKDRRSKFRGAVQFSLGEISRVAHSTLGDETFRARAWRNPSGTAHQPPSACAQSLD